MEEVGGDLELDEEEKYLEKLENGGMALQFCDYVAAWICMEDDGVRSYLFDSPLLAPRSPRLHGWAWMEELILSTFSLETGKRSLQNVVVSSIEISQRPRWSTRRVSRQHQRESS